jgi:hypothetical protein
LGIQANAGHHACDAHRKSFHSLVVRSSQFPVLGLQLTRNKEPGTG